MYIVVYRITLAGHDEYLAINCAESLRLWCTGVASSERGLAVMTFLVQGLDLTEMARNLAFSRFRFREQSAEKFRSTPLNRRSATHRRNTRMEGSPQWQRVCCRPTGGGQNGIDLQCHGMIDL